MKTQIEVSALPGFPDVSGPHELAWSYLLDAIFADAYHAQLGILHLQLPSPSLVAGAELRAELSSAREGSSGAGVALLGCDRTVPTGVRRVYLLRFGRLAPRGLQVLPAPDVTSWRLEHRLSTFTLKAKLWGIPIRVASGVGRPDLVDRAMFAMRQDFSRSGVASSYYRLSTWSQA
mgnify:CR=1 FL=1